MKLKTEAWQHSFKDGDRVTWRGDRTQSGICTGWVADRVVVVWDNPDENDPVRWGGQYDPADIVIARVAS